MCPVQFGRCAHSASQHFGAAIWWGLSLLFESVLGLCALWSPSPHSPLRLCEESSPLQAALPGLLVSWVLPRGGGYQGPRKGWEEERSWRPRLSFEQVVTPTWIKVHVVCFYYLVWDKVFSSLWPVMHELTLLTACPTLSLLPWMVSAHHQILICVPFLERSSLSSASIFSHCSLFFSFKTLLLLLSHFNRVQLCATP